MTEEYLLDANVFMEANRRYYQEEIVPSFWEFLKNDKDIFTLEKVKEEIEDGSDNLTTLTKDVQIFKYNISNDFQVISDYIQENYLPEDSEKFFSKADFPLACIAKREDFILVTHEKLLGKGAKKVSIANICEKFNIEYCNTFEMLKKKQINLSLYKKNSY